MRNRRFSFLDANLYLCIFSYTSKISVKRVWFSCSKPSKTRKYRSLTTSIPVYSISPRNILMLTHFAVVIRKENWYKCTWVTIICCNRGKLFMLFSRWMQTTILAHQLRYAGKQIASRASYWFHPFMSLRNGNTLLLVAVHVARTTSATPIFWFKIWACERHFCSLSKILVDLCNFFHLAFRLIFKPPCVYTIFYWML